MKLTVGQRVRFKHDTDRYPHFIIPEGYVGTVNEVEDDPTGDTPTGQCGTVKVDVPVLGMAGLEWDNQFQFGYGEDELDFEVVADDTPDQRCAHCEDRGGMRCVMISGHEGAHDYYLGDEEEAH